MLPRTWLLQRWQRPPWCWSGNAPWPNWTPSDWFTYLLMATGPRTWSQAPLSLTPWGALHRACCTPSVSLLRGAAGPVYPPPSQHPQVSTAKNTPSIFKSNVLDIAAVPNLTLWCLKCLGGISGRQRKLFWHKCLEVYSYQVGIYSNIKTLTFKIFYFTVVLPR